MDSVAADRARLAEIDTEISLLECSLSTLREQRAQVQERLDSCRYPVLTLPIEITSAIFINFIPNYSQYPPLTGLFSPTLLTQICRHWRQIAVAMPGLWRAISFDIDAVPFKKQLHLCHIWLTRSRSCPLTIRSGDLPRPQMSQVFEAITPHRERWESLDLYLAASDFTAIEGPMPILRHLSLGMDDDLDHVVTFPPAPLLRSIILHVTTPLKIAFPLGQLTRLVLDLAFRQEYVAILQQTFNLVHCELGIVVGQDTGLPLEHAIELPCLKSLALSVWHSSTPRTWDLDDFLVPALRSLRLPESFLGSKPIDHLSTFISKCGCKLQQVCVVNRRLLSEASYREAFPSIHRFSFADERSDTPSISTDSSQ
ncbi:hypothetical protein K438DRAFT_440802 [Mycena galopus ATCC 62051]|nr:hypothetical protein K438DRAFT_440802 [Mycena galopus ATCC 62051]